MSVSKKVAFITGITGQMGSYLTELLVSKDYEVHGLVREAEAVSSRTYKNVYAGIKIHVGNMEDSARLEAIIRTISPDEIYNLAALSQVAVSWERPELVLNVNGLGIIRILDAVRSCGLNSKTRVLSAGSSEMFGRVATLPINEDTPIAPRTPYGTSKALAYWNVRNYRDQYDLFATTAILFNHESIRRGVEFTTSYLARNAALCALGKMDSFPIHDPETIRDWGHAMDGCKCMWLMLQHDKPDDYIVASGEGHTVREFVETAFGAVGTDLKWEGSGLDEVAKNILTGQVLVTISPDALVKKPNDQQGNNTRARSRLGWKIEKRFVMTVHEMTRNYYSMEAMTKGT